MKETKRFPTREVRIGNLLIGGNHPIRIQSMVNTPPGDPHATADQILRLADAGCELVRLTVPGMKDIPNLEKVKLLVQNAGIGIPLVADVHFNADIALACAGVVEKVRINPGNYRKPGQKIRLRWNDAEYQDELTETEELLEKLMEVCRLNGTAIRIGSNHGSLSPRIMHRYGDTPLGMVEAALEYVRIFHRQGFHELVLSMKSSNVRVMVMAYRLLVEKMLQEGLNYPLHLGVTEAGFGDEGVIKSAAGIGLLLEEGIGDTIRVSLTGDPVEEIPAARVLAGRFARFFGGKEANENFMILADTAGYHRRETIPVAGIGGNHLPQVIADQNVQVDPAPDLFAAVSTGVSISLRDNNGALNLPIVSLQIRSLPETLANNPICILLPLFPEVQVLQKLKPCSQCIPVLQVPLQVQASMLRRWIALIDQHLPGRPVILKIDCDDALPFEALIHSSVIASCLFNDGLADALWISGEQDPQWLVKLAFGILQATRARITAPEYISCPSCGRTRFNIREVAGKIRERTAHLTGLKIGIMGCIVNGPGEMADADYGYVGSGSQSVTLYKGKQVMQRGVNERDAIEALIDLIKEGGDWKEP